MRHPANRAREDEDEDEDEDDPNIVPVPRRLAERRHLEPDPLGVYEVFWNRETKCWVIPLHTPEGILVGAQVKQQGVVRTLPKGIDKAKLLYGHHRNDLGKFVVVVESPLDVVRLHQCGIQAVAVMGSYISEDQMALLDQYLGVVACLDNDNAGEKGNAFLSKRARCVWTARYDDYPYKDPGEFPNDTELREFIRSSCPFL
jgi:hypothetical protein